MLGLVGGAPGGETPRVADSSAADEQPLQGLRGERRGRVPRGLPGQDPDAAHLGQGRRFRALLSVPVPRGDLPRRGSRRVGGRLRRDAAQRVL